MSRRWGQFLVRAFARASVLAFALLSSLAQAGHLGVREIHRNAAEEALRQRRQSEFHPSRFVRKIPSSFLAGPEDAAVAAAFGPSGRPINAGVLRTRFVHQGIVPTRPDPFGTWRVKRQEKRTAAFDADLAKLFSTMQRIQHRNNVVQSLPGLQLNEEIDGRDDLARHLRESFGLDKDVDALSGSFDHSAKVFEYQTTENTKKNPLTLLRLYGGDPGTGGSTMRGRWFFCCLHSPDAEGTALPIRNTMDKMAIVRVPPNTRMLVGVAADQSAPEMRRMGGNTQFFFPNGLLVPEDAYSQYERVKRRHPDAPDELMVVRDDGRTARFKPVRKRTAYQLPSLGAAGAK